MLIDDVQQAMFQAMKARRSDEVAALRLALSALKSAAIDARKQLSDDEAVAVLQREARKRREAEQVYRDAGRPGRLAPPADHQGDGRAPGQAGARAGALGDHPAGAAAGGVDDARA